MVFVSFLSGMASLIYQVVWQRCLAQEIGVDSTSTAIIVTIFLLGLGLGYYCGSFLTAAAEKHLPSLYAFAELSIGAFGFFSVFLIRWINAAFMPPSASYMLDFTAHFFLFLFPTFLMGVSTPLLIARCSLE